jgi:anti-sigma regulatory factor (Ser/Thr protein kinase)
LAPPFAGSAERSAEERAGSAASALDFLAGKGNGRDGLDVRLDGGADAAARARRAIERLEADLEPRVFDSIRLLVSELVGNSVKHAGAAQVGLRVLVTDASLWAEVSDHGPGFAPTPRGAERESESGWGLFLVGRLANRWGVVRDDSCTRVWFELARA